MEGEENEPEIDVLDVVVVVRELLDRGTRFFFFCVLLAFALVCEDDGEGDVEGGDGGAINGWPTDISYKTQPKDQTSIAGPYGICKHTSGAR